VGVAAWVAVLCLMVGALARELVEQRHPQSGSIS